MEYFKWFSEVISKYNFVSLWDIAEFQYGLWESAQDSWDLVYIRITDIDEFWLLKKDDLKFVTEQESFWNSILKKWDVLVARTWATYWKTLYFDEDFRATYGGFLIRIKLDTSIILPKFYFYFTHTSLYWNNAKRLVWWWWQPQFNANAVKQLQIPLPPLEIQNQIVEKMDLALKEKKQKELEAKILLESIDNFVLSELWIEYKKVEEKKVFTISVNEVMSEWRLDPLNFQKKDKHIEKTKYKIWKLLEFAKVTKWQSISSDKIVSGDIPVIAWWQTSPYNHNIANYNWNIITISASWAYSWYVWYHNYPIFASDCSVVFSKDENILKTEFLSYFLKVRQNYIYSLQQWAWQPHVYWNDIEILEIPLPPLEIQEKIALEVKNRIEKAKVLESEAKDVYEKAKKEVEEMILD